jgi:hypothetical protein
LLSSYIAFRSAFIMFWRLGQDGFRWASLSSFMSAKASSDRGFCVGSQIEGSFNDWSW